MPTTKATRLNVTSPIGVFAWPYITEPAPPFKDGDKAAFRVDVVLDPKDKKQAAALAILEAQLTEYGEARREEMGYHDDVEIILPIKDQMEKVEGKTKKVPTGMTIIRAKMPAERTPKRGGPPIPQTLEVLDSQMNHMTGVTVGAGSEGRVAGNCGAFYSEKDEVLYVTIYMEGVQVTKLVEKTSYDFNPDRYELGAVEGGYEAPAPVDTPEGEEEGDY